MKIHLPKLKCKRCSHEWVPRITARPKHCPECTSKIWDKDTKQKCGVKPSSVEELFWSRVVKENGDSCWGWIGSFDKNGYGKFKSGGKPLRAHRVSYVIHKGAIPDGILVCHTCDNPQCSNPLHLFLGTNQDNRDDCVNKNRHSFGERNKGGCKLTESDALHILNDNRPHNDIAKSFNVSAVLVAKIKSGAAWKHLYAKLVKQRRLSPQEIQSVLNDTGTCKEVADRHGLTASSICRIRKKYA